jgi:NO-binding membrane sensor protein with MHYT domain/nitrogen-specific signal transduction histidine kinase/ActR/RegA family two-component response regulator
MPIHGTYSTLLVILSVLIASAASYTALDLAGQVTAARGRERLAWLAGGSAAMGIGIWSMHFVGMLAFHLPVPITYGIGRVLLSVLVAIAASAMALVIVSRASIGIVALALGAIFMGPAIAGMHYIGMAALNAPAAMHFNALLVTVSVGIAIAASFAGLALAYRFRTDQTTLGRRRRMASAVILGLAVAGMHYTGMAAAHFSVPGVTGRPTSGMLATGELAIAVTLGTLVILGLGLFGAMADRWVRRRTDAAVRQLQSQKLEAIGQLAGGIAHDFNNLLTAILGYAEFLLQSLGPGDPRHEDVMEIQRAATRAAELTHQLLAFSRRQMLQPKLIDLNAALADTMRMLSRLVGEHIQVGLVADPNLGLIRADPTQLEQVVVNLVVNARDAMPEGGKLTIETQNVELEPGYSSQLVGAQPGSYVMMAFTDTGLGMDPATQARIFEPFFSTKERDKGTGLGLSTVYGIVKQSGGNISVYSEPGHGSTFKIYLPRVREAAPTPVPSEARTSSLMGTETVLIVEDEVSVRELAARVLQIYGYRTLVATDGAQALALAQQHHGPIHLLLTDLVLPHMSGKQTAEQLARFRPELRVLYMSGFTESALAHRGDLGTTTPSFIEKPFAPVALATKVREALTQPAPSPAAP